MLTLHYKLYTQPLYRSPLLVSQTTQEFTYQPRADRICILSRSNSYIVIEGEAYRAIKVESQKVFLIKLCGILYNF